MTLTTKLFLGILAAAFISGLVPDQHWLWRGLLIVGVLLPAMWHAENDEDEED